MVSESDLRNQRQNLINQIRKQTSQSSLRRGGLNERLQRQQSRSQLQSVNRNIATNELNSKLQNVSFTNLSQLKQFESSLSPEARQLFLPELQKAQTEQTQKVSQVESLIEETKNRIAEAQSRVVKARMDNDRDREKTYERDVQTYNAYLSGLQEGLSKLESGDLISVSSITTYANQKENQRLAEVKNLESIKSAGFKSQREYIKAVNEAERVVGKPVNEITSVTQLQANQLSVPAQKVLGIKASDFNTKPYSEIFINGQGYSVIGGKENEFIKSKTAQNNLPNMNLVLSEAPTLSQQYKTSISEGGVIKGTLNFLGEKASGKTTQATGYEPLGNLARVTTKTAPYFSPYGIGSALFIGGGVEDLATPSGRERLSERSQQLQEKGYSPAVSNIVSYGTPVGEISLGSLSLYGELKGVKATQEARLLENAPTKTTGIRLDAGSSGIDFVSSVKQTTPNWFQSNILRIKPATQTTEIIQPYYLTSSGEKVLFESGFGSSLLRQGNKFSGSSFKLSGRAYLKDEGINWVRIDNGVKVKTPTNFESGYGRLSITEDLSSVGTIKKGSNSVSAKGTITSSDKTYKEIFLGGSKELEGSEGVFGLFGGDVKYLQKNYNSYTIGAKPEQVGYMKIFDFSKPETEFVGGSNLLTTGKTSGGSLGYIEKAVEKTSQVTASKIVSKPTKTINPSPLGSLTNQKTSQVTTTQSSSLILPSAYSGTGQYERTEEVSSLAFPSKPANNQLETLQTSEREREKVRIAEIQSVSQIQPQREKISPILVSKVDTGLKEGERVKSILKLAQSTTQEQKQRLRQLSSTSLIQKAIKKTQIIPPLLPPLPKNSKSESKSKGIISGIFKVFGRRRGRDILLATETSQAKAESDLLKFLKGTLGRSGKIVKNGEELAFSDLKSFGSEFRPAKKSNKRIVQKAEFSLGTTAEVKEIQFFKKRKGKKNGFI